MNDKICVIMLGGEKQQECFWNSYYNCRSGFNHDLIIVHRNKFGLPELDKIYNTDGSIILENKIDKNGNDIPHKAFGAYRYYYNKYKDIYDIFIFISDDVVIKRDEWIFDIVKLLNMDEKLGFGSSQIFNGDKKYPHESHIRAPFWFAKKNALSSIKWDFNNDHDGEMKIANQLTSAGYFGVQIGNKIDFAFDSTEKNHITQIIEKKYFNEKSPYLKYKESEFNYFYNKYITLSNNEIENEFIISPYEHINRQNVFIDIEPFNLLIYRESLDIAKKRLPVVDIGYNINLLGT